MGSTGYKYTRYMYNDDPVQIELFFSPKFNNSKKKSSLVPL